MNFSLRCELCAEIHTGPCYQAFRGPPSEEALKFMEIKKDTTGPLEVNCGDNMVTFTGLYVNPRKLKLEDIRIQDIAHHLSIIPRYAGATKRHYSVAQHSVHGAAQADDPVIAFLFLMHDTPEYLVCDLVRCVKHGLPDFQNLEETVWRSIVNRFNFRHLLHKHYELPASVAEIDLRMLVTERFQLLVEQDFVWDHQKNYKPYDLRIPIWTPEEAEQQFLFAFYALCSQLDFTKEIVPNGLADSKSSANTPDSEPVRFEPGETVKIVKTSVFSAQGLVGVYEGPAPDGGFSVRIPEKDTAVWAEEIRRP